MEVRKQSILLQRRGISIEQLDHQSRSISSLAPQGHQHHFARGSHGPHGGMAQVAGSPPRAVQQQPQASQHRRAVGKHGRLGYTKSASTGLAGNAKRLVGGLLGGLLGDPMASSTEPQTPQAITGDSIEVSSTPAQVGSSSSTPVSASSSSPVTSSASSSSGGSGKKGHSQKHTSSKSSESSSGYSKVAYQAAISGNLTPANAPTAEESLGMDIEANDVGYIANIEIGTPATKFRMLVSRRFISIISSLRYLLNFHFTLFHFRRSILDRLIPGLLPLPALNVATVIKS